MTMQYAVAFLTLPLLVLSQSRYELALDVDDVWMIPENTKVGSIVKEIKLVKTLQSLNYIFSLEINEPNKKEFEGFFEASRGGKVKLLKSLEGYVSTLMKNKKVNSK